MKFRKKHLDNKVSAGLGFPAMNVVILGAGLVGWQLARQLISEGKEGYHR